MTDFDSDSSRAGAIYCRPLDGDREVVVYRMLYNYRVCLSETGEAGMILDAYCYRDLAVALDAARTWDGCSPIADGWHKNPFTGVSRPDGDPAKQYGPGRRYGR